MGSTRLGRTALLGASIATVLLIWELAGNVVHDIFLVPFSETLAQLVFLLRTGTLVEAIWETGSLFIIGLAMSTLGGFLIGIMIGSIEYLRRSLNGYLVALYALPSVTLIPIILALFGFGSGPKLIIIVWSGIFPVILNTIEGVRSVPRELLEVARAFRSSHVRMRWDVIMPSVLPHGLVGVRHAISRCMVGTIASEFFLGGGGFGELLLLEARRFNTGNVLALLLILLLTGLTLIGIGRRLVPVMAPWHRGIGV